MALKYVGTTAKMDRLQSLAWIICSNIDILNGTFITFFKVDINMQYLSKLGFTTDLVVFVGDLPEHIYSRVPL